MSHVVTFMRVEGDDGKGYVRMAFDWTRWEEEEDVLLELDDSRDKRSRTTCGMSMR